MDGLQLASAYASLREEAEKTRNKTEPEKKRGFGESV